MGSIYQPLVHISAPTRENLLALSDTSNRITIANSRLNSGLRVRNAVDDAVAFYAAKAIDYRAEDVKERKYFVDQGLSSLQVAGRALEAAADIGQQIKGLLNSAKIASEAERKELTTQVRTLFEQLDNLIEDASYQGTNLINGTASELNITFTNNTQTALEVQGRNLKTYGLIGVSAGDIGNSLTSLGVATVSLSQLDTTNISSIDDAVDTVQDGIDALRGATRTFGSNITLLQTRLQFANDYVNYLEEGSNKLRLADINEEGANLVALQTRQQLGVQALAFSGSAERSVLRLFS